MDGHRSVKFFVLLHREQRFDFTDFITNEMNGIKFYASSVSFGNRRFDLTLRPQQDGEFFVGLAYSGDEPSELQVGVDVPITFSDQSYTLIPGVCYNGNTSEPVREIPALNAANDYCFEAPLSACAIPIAMHYDGAGRVQVLRGSPFTRAGSSGFVADKPAGVMRFMVPAYERVRFRSWRWDGRPRYGMTMHPGETLTFSFQYEEREADSVLEMFRLLNREYRAIKGYAGESSAPVAFQQGAVLVADYFMREHLAYDPQGHPMLLNAHCAARGMKYGHSDVWAEWVQLTGWCGGSMTAYALLALCPQQREILCANLDFLAAKGLSPSGLAHPIYDGEQWLSTVDAADPEKYHPWNHIRPPADFITYLLRAARVEQHTGITHPGWLAAARRGLDAFCRIWDRYGDFGFHINRYIDPPEMREGGSCAGAFPLQALTEGMRAFPDEIRYRDVYRTAARHYYQHFVASGHCTGGPLDIHRADDSESAAALAEAFLRGWEILGDAELLQWAEDAAQIFATWVLSYAAPFPPGTPLFGHNPCGGVLANVQNWHVGPGICTNSARFLYDLAHATGNEFYAQLYRDVTHGALNFITLADGEVMGWEDAFGPAGWLPLPRGMMSEQVNLADSMNDAGQTWAVSCSWPATALLLAWAEAPTLEKDLS